MLLFLSRWTACLNLYSCPPTHPPSHSHPAWKDDLPSSSGVKIEVPGSGLVPTQPVPSQRSMPLSCFLEPTLLHNLILVFLMWHLVPLSIPAFSSFGSSYLAGRIFNPWECKPAFFLLHAVFLFPLPPPPPAFKTRSLKGLVDAPPSHYISSRVSGFLQSLKRAAHWAAHSPYSFSNSTVKARHREFSSEQNKSLLL